MSDKLINKIHCNSGVWINNCFRITSRYSSQCQEIKRFFVGREMWLVRCYWKKIQANGTQKGPKRFSVRNWVSSVLKCKKMFKKYFICKTLWRKVYWVGLFCHLLLQCTAAIKQHKFLKSGYSWCDCVCCHVCQPHLVLSERRQTGRSMAGGCNFWGSAHQ